MIPTNLLKFVQFAILASFAACGARPAPGPPTLAGASSPAVVADMPAPAAATPLETSGDSRRLIWKGRAGAASIEWTTGDLFVTWPSSTRRPVLRPLVAKYHQSGIREVRRFLRRQRDRTTENVVSLGQMKIVSAVGPFVTFEIGLAGWIDGGGTSTEGVEWRTLDLRRPTASLFEVDEPSGDIRASDEIRLTDLFAAEELESALLANPRVAAALATRPAERRAAIVRELVRNGGELPLDEGNAVWWLNASEGFAIAGVSDGKVKVELQLFQKAADSNQLETLELALPIPLQIQESVTVTASGQEGFFGTSPAPFGDDMAEIKIETAVAAGK